ncbi:hypothetical protein SAMD00019534_099550 [Acytostelium subglobosum LB1]|uniref:hypothetical protein n=1 Tax=Acytostelium subglobosum LB1 TaxID=1410327 RepID=UPI000644B1E4|nr:hypothetical protein SAMD00019534_099550 [Acytostelium subglobosum LB1]GAM26780.1 hypothetical protein SAMD00019534_099550 [Acytostelium subglobosum LB1]|eukprot:XP_012750441.1 hypothetical protein SAMD00019534_099550 [Acytostelium subglobosum LB1]
MNLSQKDYDALWCSPRLNQLWKTLQQCATSYQTLERLRSEVTGHFEQLIKVLMAQEHKVKTPINSKMEHIKATMSHIVAELRDINCIINMSHPINHSNNEEQDDETSQLIIDTFTKCKSMTELLNNSLCQSNDEKDDHKSPLNDDELLSMIDNHIQLTTQWPYGDHYSTLLREPCQVMIDTKNLKDVKDIIESSFTLIQPELNAFDRHIFSIYENHYSLYSLETKEWTHYKDQFNQSFNSNNSLVFARGNVYVFGGAEPNCCTNISLSERKLKRVKIGILEGQNHVSAVYDGSNNIYLLGDGASKVVCVNLDTRKFSTFDPIGVDSTQLFSSYETHYH